MVVSWSVNETHVVARPCSVSPLVFPWNIFAFSRIGIILLKLERWDSLAVVHIVHSQHPLLLLHPLYFAIKLLFLLFHRFQLLGTFLQLLLRGYNRNFIIWLIVELGVGFSHALRGHISLHVFHRFSSPCIHLIPLFIFHLLNPFRVSDLGLIHRVL